MEDIAGTSAMDRFVYKGGNAPLRMICEKLSGKY